MATFLDRTAAAWCEMSGAAGAAFEPDAVTVVTAERSLMAPPGWVGVVRLGNAALVTAPTDALAERVRLLLNGMTPAEACDPAALLSGALGADVLGPATLAYLDPSDFRPVAADAVRAVPVGPEVEALEAAAGPEDAGEVDLRYVQSPAFVTWTDDGVITAGCGYRVWLGVLAHQCVLTHPDYRGRGLAKAVASAATAHALEAGLVPQWRARPADSRAVARSLGYTYLGDQLSIQF